MIFKNVNILFLSFVFLLFSLQSKAQKVVIDEVIQAGDLNVLPSLSNPNEYFYLLDKARIAKKRGEPQFSFVRYVKKNPNGADAEVGGFVHTLVELYCSKESIRRAEKILQRRNPNAKIVGAAPYETGTMTLVASLDDGKGSFINKIVGVGNAPVLANQKVAVGLQLTGDGANVLWKAADLPTSQLSVTFSMTLLGYRSPMEVKIKADIDRIRKHRTFEAAAVTPVFAGEINKAYEELFDNGAISVIEIGSDESMDRMKENAFDQLTKWLLDPVGNSGTPSAKDLNKKIRGKSALDVATERLNSARQETREMIKYFASNNKDDDTDYEAVNFHMNQIMFKGNKEKNKPDMILKMPSMAMAVSYRTSKSKIKGTKTIDLKKTVTGTKMFPFSVNLGLKKSTCRNCYKTIQLDDIIDNQKFVNLLVDVKNANDFKDYINTVSVELKKTHESGANSTDTKSINYVSFNQDDLTTQLFYPWKEGDRDESKWNAYDYRVVWTYEGGVRTESDWISSNENIITLSPSMVSKTINFETTDEFVSRENIYSIVVKVFYHKDLDPKEIRINTKKGEREGLTEIFLPANQSAGYACEVIFYKNNNGNIEPSAPVRVESSEGVNFITNVNL